MKKSLIALAVMAAAGAASAQSTVTLFGVVDANVGNYRNGDANVTKMNTSGLASSRLGFRGVEDLGGGLKAEFWLEAGINPDSGTGQGTSLNNQAGVPGNAGLVFNRRSTVAVNGGFGEVRLGRDYTPGFRALTEFDPFGTLGVAQGSNLSLIGTAPQTGVRASNSVAYLWNDNGFGAVKPGFYAQAQYRFGENASNSAIKNDGTGYGIRVGFAQGPMNFSATYDLSKLAGPSSDKYTQINLAGSYDLGVAKLMAGYDQNKTNAGATYKIVQVGATIPVGAGYIPVSYNDLRSSGAANAKANQFGIGYVYNLSKRTAVYTSYANLGNKNGTAYGVGGGLAGVADKRSSGLEFGVKHSF